MPIYLLPLTVTFIWFTGLFVISQQLKRLDIVDIGWGIGFILIAWTTLISSGTIAFRPLLLTLLITIWGLRLALHILLRNKGKSEDYRYQAMRTKWGRFPALKAYLTIFMLQGLLMLIIASPIILTNLTTSAFTPLPLDIIGYLIWLAGFLFETIADYQLTEFKSKSANKGKIITTGLWRYSRHPNYFGEALLWWGIFIITLNVPHGYLTIASPILITLLVTKISGIPLLEKKYASNPDFKRYATRTSIFIPWFPKR